MKTIITLDKANQAYGFPQLNGNAHYDDIISDSGITANTISATTYYNLPISGVTDGTGISTSITDGNLTITSTGTTQNLIASNSCAITPDNRVYVGNSNYGWGFGLWDLVFGVAASSEQYANVSIPINKTILSGESINVCGKVYVDDSDGESCWFYFYLYTHNCDITTVTELRRFEDPFNKGGVVCFNYRIPIESDLSACDNFLILGFKVATNDATVCKITYTINSLHNI